MVDEGPTDWTFDKALTPVVTSVANKLARTRQQLGGRKKKKKEQEERRCLERDASMVDDSRCLPTRRHRSLDKGEFK